MTPTEIVRKRLKKYSDQGVFQGLREIDGRSGRTTFSFRWLLGNEFSFVVDPKKQEIVARDLLPAIDNHSFIDRDLRRFVGGRTDLGLPEHRRLDADRVSLTYRNRKQIVSLVMRVREGQNDYAIRALLGALNDLFSHLHLYHIDYLQRNFGVPEE